MMDHFAATFFINARRLLVPNGVLIVNTLENYFPDEFGEMRRENRKEEKGRKERKRTLESAKRTYV